MKLPNRFGATVVASTEDLMSLLQDIFDDIPSTKEISGLEDDNSSLEAKVNELKEEVRKLKKENEKLKSDCFNYKAKCDSLNIEIERLEKTILGLRSDKEAINNVAKHLIKKLPKKGVK